MVLLPVAGDVNILQLPRPTGAENNHGLGFVGHDLQFLHDLFTGHLPFLHVTFRQVVGFADVLDGVVDVGLLLAIDGICQGQTVFPVALWDDRDGVDWWIGCLPYQIAVCPGLQDHDQKKNDERAKVDEQIFPQVCSDNQRIL